MESWGWPRLLSILCKSASFVFLKHTFHAYTYSIKSLMFRIESTPLFGKAALTVYLELSIIITRISRLYLLD